MIGLKVKEIVMRFLMFFIRNFAELLLLQFILLKSKVDQYQKYSLGNSYKITLVSQFSILAQKLSKKGRNEKSRFF